MGKQPRGFKERDPRLDEMAEACYQAAAALERGDVLHYQTMEKKTGIQRRYSTHWNSVVRKLRKLMRDRRGIQLEAVATVGYKLMQTDSQILELNRRERLNGKAIRRQIQMTEAIDAKELTEKQQELRARHLEVAKASARQATASVRHLNALTRVEVRPR